MPYVDRKIRMNKKAFYALSLGKLLGNIDEFLIQLLALITYQGLVKLDTD